MTVLVTGASGFLGGRVAGLLVEDHQVVATGRRFPRERHDALTAAGVRVVVADLTHVDNAAHAARLAVASSVSGPVNIADGTPTAIWAGIDQVADALGVARPQRRLPAGLVEAVASGNERLARTLGRGEPRLTVVGIRLLTRGGAAGPHPCQDRIGLYPDLHRRPHLVLEHLQAGWCVSLGALAQRGEPWRIRRFAAGATLIRHPEHGLVLFDTGYSRAALEAIRHWPAWPYGHLLPVRLPPGQALVEQFAARGEADAVQAIICSHLHMDHLSGAVDFPHAPVWMDPADITTLASYDGFAAVRHGVVPAIRPAARRLRPFRYSPAPAWLAPFTRAMDFFGDRSLWIVPSPGHTDGSVAAIARTQTDNTEGAGLVLLAGDVAWSERSLRQGIEPHWLASRAVIHDLAAGFALCRR